ncbi:MAG: alkaline phosphatase family protein [Candidatus Hodarchaeota archaeon]
MNKINRIILCIIDDVNSDHFFKLVNKGHLLNFEKLMRNGIFSTNCITDFPAITFPTQVSIITGTYTGDYRNELCHGVPMYDWMERSVSPPILRSYGTYGSNKRVQIYKINEDIGNNCKTIIEMVGEGNSTSIAQFINRGTKYFFPERKTKLIMNYLFIKYYKNVKEMMVRVNSVIIKKLLQTFKNPSKFFDNQEPPIASLLWFVTSDLLMHSFGYDSKIYELNLRHIDKVMGHLIEELDRLGYLDDTALAITSDHGNYKANRIGNLDLFLRSKGLTQYHPRKNVKGNMDLAEFGGLGFFYFKSNNPISKKIWEHPNLECLKVYGPMKVNLFQELFKIDGTELMYYKDDENSIDKGIIYLKRKNPETNKIESGSIEYRGNSKNLKTKYISENQSNDIFGYFDDSLAVKLIDNKYHSIEEWLEATYQANYPLYPDLLIRHFKNPRSADIIISTKGKIAYNIRHGREKRSSYYLHDIGLRRNAVVPLIIAGSNEIPQREVSYCKITDIVPTLLKMLGKSPHKSVIGKTLI